MFPVPCHVSLPESASIRCRWYGKRLSFVSAPPLRGIHRTLLRRYHLRSCKLSGSETWLFVIEDKIHQGSNYPYRFVHGGSLVHKYFDFMFLFRNFLLFCIFGSFHRRKLRKYLYLQWSLFFYIFTYFFLKIS